MYVVYGIIDPRTDAVFYIGQSSDFVARKAAHFEGSDQLSGYAVKQMRLNGFVPLFVILERMTTKAQALSAEIFWIEVMKARGAELLNAQGVGGYVERGRLRRQFSGTLAAMVVAKAESTGDRTAATLEDIANGWCRNEFRRALPWPAIPIRIALRASAIGQSASKARRVADRPSSPVPA